MLRRVCVRDVGFFLLSKTTPRVNSCRVRRVWGVLWVARVLRWRMVRKKIKKML